MNTRVPYVQRDARVLSIVRDYRIEWGTAVGRDFSFFFPSLLLRSYHRSCRPPDRDTISLSPRTRVMPRRNDSTLSCIRSGHSLLDVGVTNLYAVLLDPGVCYSNHRPRYSSRCTLEIFHSSRDRIRNKIYLCNGNNVHFL